MALTDVCIHTVTPIATVAQGPLVEGERDEQPVPGTPFMGVLFLPLGQEEPGAFKPRKITRPTLLCLPLDTAGQPVKLKPEDELTILAPELEPWTGAIEARWQIDGSAQPFGPPGSVIGLQANLVKVDD